MVPRFHRSPQAWWLALVTATPLAEVAAFEASGPLDGLAAQAAFLAASCLTVVVCFRATRPGQTSWRGCPAAARHLTRWFASAFVLAWGLVCAWFVVEDIALGTWSDNLTLDDMLGETSFYDLTRSLAVHPVAEELARFAYLRWAFSHGAVFGGSCTVFYTTCSLWAHGSFRPLTATLLLLLTAHLLATGKLVSTIRLHILNNALHFLVKGTIAWIV